MDLRALASALPSVSDDHATSDDSNKLRRRTALQMLMDASVDASNIPRRGDESPFGYCNTVGRETLQEHRALLARHRVYDEDWVRWPPMEEKETGLHTNNLVIVAEWTPGQEITARLAFAVYIRVCCSLRPSLSSALLPPSLCPY